MNPNHTAKSVRAYARGTRLALGLQLIVAAIALGASTWLGLRIKDQKTRLAVSQQQLAESQEELEGTQAKLSSNVQVLQRLQNASSQMSAAPPKYDLAIVELRTAYELLNEPSSEAGVAIVSLLAEAQFNGGSFLDAVSSGRESLRLVEKDEAAATTATIFLAKYYCAAGQLEQAKALIEKNGFVRSNTDKLLGEDGFVGTCSELAKSIAVQTPTRQVISLPGVTSTSGFKVHFAFLHIRQESERAAAIRIAETLCRDGTYSVPGIELIAEPSPYPAKGNIRYYFAVQKPEAQALALQIGTLMRNEGWPAEPPVARPVVGLKGLPTERVEVWLADKAGSAAGSRQSSSAESRFSCFSDADAQWLVRRLNESTTEPRLQAGELVAIGVRGSASRQIVGALVDQLSQPRLDQLSADGRFNVLYMLNLRQTWPDELGQTLAQRLATIESRDASVGVKIGKQTRDCIESLKAKIRGERSANTCGRGLLQQGD